MLIIGGCPQLDRFWTAILLEDCHIEINLGSSRPKNATCLDAYRSQDFDIEIFEPIAMGDLRRMEYRDEEGRFLKLISTQDSANPAVQQPV